MEHDVSVISSEEITSIQEAIKNKEQICYNCYELTQGKKEKFLSILKLFLSECCQDDLYNSLSYCLLELLDNASRANAKRIFFTENNLDINNQEDYKNGMKLFKAEINDNSRHYLQKSEDQELTIKFLLSVENEIAIQVANNSKITEMELERINEKIAKTEKYASMQEAFGDIDQTEGCGLGIMSIIFMLRKLGLESNCLNFSMTDSLTIATIRIPLDYFCGLDSI